MEQAEKLGKELLQWGVSHEYLKSAYLNFSAMVASTYVFLNDTEDIKSYKDKIDRENHILCELLEIWFPALVKCCMIHKTKTIDVYDRVGVVIIDLVGKYFPHLLEY